MMEDYQRCATCIWFGNDEKQYMNEEPFRPCTRLPETANRNDERPPEGRLDNYGFRDWKDDADWMLTNYPDTYAYTADASSYRSILYVRPEYGCVHWEGDDDADAEQ